MLYTMKIRGLWSVYTNFRSLGIENENEKLDHPNSTKADFYLTRRRVGRGVTNLQSNSIAAMLEFFSNMTAIE